MHDAPNKNNQSANSTGDRSVAIAGGATNVTINTGDTTIINLPTSEISELMRQVLESKIETLSSDLSKEKAERLELLLEKFREGQSEESFEAIRELRKSANWDTFEPALKASILRTLAQMTLILKNKDGVEEAKSFAAEARKFNQSNHNEILDARISIFEIGFKAAADKFSKIRTTESYNLWLNCLLNSRDFTGVAEAHNNPPSDIKLNAETHRFFSLAFLALKNIAAAKQEINLALSEKPNWQYVRFTAAIIDYFSAVSPTVLPDQLVAYPRPIQFASVKIDNLSQENLRRAAAEFSNLTEEFNQDSNVSRECRTWHFASIVNQVGKQSEAIQIGLELLEKDPTNLQILSWFLFRGYEFDREKSLAVLTEKEESRNVSIEDILGLTGINVNLGNCERALEIINRNEEVFNKIGENDLLRYWRGTALLQSEKPEESKIEESQINDPVLKRLLAVNIFFDRGEKLNDWNPLLKFWGDTYEQKNDQESFLSLYELKVQKVEDKKFVSDKAAEYCALTETASSVDFVVQALWKWGESQQCLELLEKYVSFFPDAKLPDHLGRIKIHALVKKDYKKASEEAALLAKESPSSENIVLLMDVQLVRGDFSGLISTSKKLLQQTDTNTEQFLRAANLVKVKDPGLATKLWTKAVEKGIPEDPKLALFAQEIAFKLGLENESEEVHRLLMREAHAKRGPMKLITIKQMLKLGEKNAKRQRKIDEEYSAGEIPLQLVAEEKRMSLAEIFYWRADKNRKENIHQSPRLFTRHGARITYPASSFTESKDWNLHLDITSLLQAHKLGILEQLEDLYKPIKISIHTVTALIEQRDGLLPHQKSRLDSSRTITDLHWKTRIKLFEETAPSEILEKLRQEVETFYQEQKNFYKSKKSNRFKKKRVVLAEPGKFNTQLGDRLNEISQAAAENGLAVGLLPLNCYGTTEYSVLRLPESYSNLIIDCRSILECLKAHNRISEDKYKSVIKSLGQYSNPQAAASPLLHTKLFLMWGVADVLAKAQILAVVCENFEVLISKSSLTDAERTVQHYEELALLGDSIEELVARINNGIEDEVYKFIHIPDKKQNQNFEGKFGQDMDAVFDMFLFEPQPGDIICIDDRALTKYAVRQEGKLIIPIIGIYELLQALRQNGKLDDQEYYSALLDLRRSNFRYLPIREDEITYHLNLARCENGQIVDTEALSTLKHYHASCLLDAQSLQITNDQYSEAPFVYLGTEAIEWSIVRTWNESKTDYKLAAARSDWILGNLYTGKIGCSHLRNNKLIKESHRTDIQGLASDVSNLIMMGISLVDNPLSKDETGKLKHYFEWIKLRILQTRYISSEEVLKAVGQEVEKRINIVFSHDYETPERKILAGFTIGRLFLEIPEKVSKQISLEQRLLDWMKVKNFDVVTIEEINFLGDDYWHAIEDVISGKEASLKAADTGNKYYLSESQNDEEIENFHLFPVIKLFDADRIEITEMRDTLFGLLKPSPAARLEVIHKQRELFDNGQAEFERQAKDIANIDNSLERLKRFYKTIEKSTELLYSQIEDRIRRRDDITWQELMPSDAQNLAGYFRLPAFEADKNFSVLWNESAASLLAERPLGVAIAIISSLPVKMPELAIERYMSLAEEDKEALLKKLSNIQASPIQLLHLINLALRSINDDNSKIRDLAGELISRVYKFDNEDTDFKAFHAILLFVTNEFYFWQEKSKLSLQIALGLIWGHATRLYNICRSVGMEPENIINGFSILKENYFYESLIRNPELGRDSTYPYRVSGALFFTHAAANLFTGVNSEVLSLLKIPELIRGRVFRDREDDQPPSLALPLFNDPFLFDDKLQSLFSGDRFYVLSPIIGSAGIEALKSENLKQGAEIYLKGLSENPQQPKNWGIINAITNDLPIYQNLQNLCLEAIKNFKLEHLDQPGVENPEFILFAIVSQIATIDDPHLRKDYREKIIKMFKKKASQEDSEDVLQGLLTLLNAALAISYIPGDPAKSNDELASIIDELSNEWVMFYDRFGHSFLNNFWHGVLSDSKKWRELDLKFKSLY